MNSAIFGILGALLGSVLGFIGSLLSTLGKSKDTSKDILTRTVTNERAKWRNDLRELSGHFVENVLLIASDEANTSIYALEKYRVLIRLRLNPNPEHRLDASILQNIKNIVELVKRRESEQLLIELESFEQNIQLLLKQEWDKSKLEAETGKLSL